MKGNKSGIGGMKEEKRRKPGRGQPTAPSSPHQGRAVTPQKLADSQHRLWGIGSSTLLTRRFLFASKQLHLTSTSKMVPYRSLQDSSVT